MKLLEQYWTAIREMRTAQKRYFKTRQKDILQESISREQEVDHVLDQFSKQSIEPTEVKVGREMRKWQRMFFDRRDGDPQRSLSMARAMEFEKQIDNMVAEHFSPQQRLF